MGILYIYSFFYDTLFSPSFSSLQVEVTVSLVPPVANSGVHDVVLILSSSVPVNWAITATGLQGHISIHVRTPPLFYLSTFYLFLIC